MAAWNSQLLASIKPSIGSDLVQATAIEMAADHRRDLVVGSTLEYMLSVHYRARIVETMLIYVGRGFSLSEAQRTPLRAGSPLCSTRRV